MAASRHYSNTETAEVIRVVAEAIRLTQNCRRTVKLTKCFLVSRLGIRKCQIVRLIVKTVSGDPLVRVVEGPPMR